jgi:hypothetical protein
MRVKIVRCSVEEFWHEKYIGSEVEVKEWSHDAWFALDVEEAGGVLPKRDSKVIEGDNKMGEYTLSEVITILSVKPGAEFECKTDGGRLFEAKMLYGRELYIATEGLNDCMIPTSTIPLNLKWRLR